MSCSSSVMQRSKTVTMCKEEDPEDAESWGTGYKVATGELLIQRHSPITLDLKLTSKDLDIQF